MAEPDVHARVDPSSDEAVAGGDEIELVYVGLMRNVRGAQASAAHWEAHALADDDIAALGYGPYEDDSSREKTPVTPESNP